MYSEFIKNLSYKAKKDNLLRSISDNIKKEFGLVPVVGAEIEFYASDIIDLPAKYNLKEEKGINQFEIDILPQNDLYILVKEIEDARVKIIQIGKSKSIEISFDPKPYENDYGSAMHFHVNFLNQNGENFFENTAILEQSAKALCHYMLASFLIFAPEEYHYSRFKVGSSMAPSHVCYGGNNRTVSIRIPDASPKRLEHRISAPDIDPYIGLCAIMQSIYLGLKFPDLITDIPKIYGNAFDDQYNLVALPRNIEEAYKLYKNIFI